MFDANKRPDGGVLDEWVTIGSMAVGCLKVESSSIRRLGTIKWNYRCFRHCVPPSRMSIGHRMKFLSIEGGFTPLSSRMSSRRLVRPFTSIQSAP